MRTILTIKVAAQKLRSLFALLLLLGVLNSANATTQNTYYSNGTVSITSQAVTGTLYTNSGCTTSAGVSTLLSTDIITIVGGTVTIAGTSSTTTLGGVVMSSGALTINTGDKLYIGGATTPPAANLVMTGGTLTITGSLYISGNFAGNADGVTTQAGGTLSGAGPIIFNGGNFGTSGGVSTSGVVTTGSGASAQYLFADFHTSSYTGTIQAYTYIKLGGTTLLPTKFKLGNIATTQSVLSLNGYALTTTQFYQSQTSSTSTWYQVLTGGGNSALILNGPNATASTVVMDQTSTGSSSSTNAVNIQMNPTYSATGASSSGTTISCSSTSGFSVGQNVVVTSGTGAFASNATITGVISGTQFTVGTAPTTALSAATITAGGGTGYLTLYNNLFLASSGSYPTTLTKGIIYLNGQTVTATTYPSGSSTSYFAGGISGTAGSGFAAITSPSTNGTPTVVPIGTYNTYLPVSFANTTLTPSYTIGVAALTGANVNTSASCVQFQWTITSSVPSSVSDITFYSNAATGITSTSQLGILTASQLSGGYTNMATTLATASAYSSTTTFYTKFAAYTLPNNTTANTFVIGVNGAVYPLPTITSSLTANASAGQLMTNYTVSGANAGTFNATNLPSGIIFHSPTISGSPTSSGTYNIGLSNTNIAGQVTATLVLTVTSAPIISSATIGVARAGSAFSYNITATNTPTSYSASLITNGVGSALTGSTSPFSISGSTISGSTALTFGIDTIQLVATNSAGSCPTTYLYLNVLDVPTVTGISPSTAAVDGAGFTITVNGTNFSNGYSTVTWGGTPLTTTYVSSTQLTATVPASNIARTASASTATIGVTSSGTNAVATPSSVSLSSTVNQTFTIAVSTPTITSIYPNSNIAGAGTFAITATGTNFISGVSTITWNGSPLTTTFVSATVLRATVPSTNITTAGTPTVGVSNIGAGSTLASASTKTFTINDQGVTWSFNTDGAAFTSSGVSLTPTTLVGAPTNTNIVGYGYDSINNSRNPSALAVCPSGSSTSITWNADGGPSSAPVTPTLNTTFSGVMINNVNTSRYIQFDVVPVSGNNFSVNSISFPITNNTNTGTMYYAVAYSTNAWSTFTYMTANTTAGVIIANTAGANSVNFAYTTPFIVPSGSALSIRVIFFDNKNSSSSVTGTMNISNVTIVGSTSAAYNSPTLISSSADVNGTQNTLFDGGYTYSATVESLHANTYSATGLPAGLVINASTGAVTGTPTVQGTYAVTFKADNGNLYPLTTTINFVIDGQAGDPTTTSITPSTKAVDAAQFTITVKGTNYVSGKSTVKWIASVGDTTVLSTTFLTDTTLSAVVPASLVAATVASATPRVVVYNTGAANPTSNTRTLTITNLTPVINAITPAASTSSTSQFTLTVIGSNFTTASKVIWGGAVRPTTYVSSTQLTSTINANGTDIASVGNTSVGVRDSLAGTATNTASTQTYVVGDTKATWFVGSSNTPSIVGNLNSTITTTPTLTGVNASYSGGQILCGTSSGATSYPADGATATVNSAFTGISASVGGSTTATRSVDYYISPASGYDLSLASIAIPVSVSGGSGSMYYSAAYSTNNGTSFTQFSSASNTGNAGSGGIANTYDVNIPASGTAYTTFVPGTAISVANNTSLIVRVIAWRKNASTNTTTTVNFGPVTMVGNTTQVPTPGAPTVGDLSDGNAQVDVSFAAPTLTGTSAITSYKVYAYANGSATASTSVSATVASLSLPYHINVTGLTNNTSYQFRVSATNASGEGTLSSLSVTATPSNTTTWNGTSWSSGDPNDNTQNAIFNGNYTATYPLNCLKLTINSGYTVTNNSTITATGTTFINNGTISGTGTLVLNGSSAQTISGTGIVGNLTINTSAGTTITSGSNNLGVTGVLTLQSGLLTTNGNLTLKSTSIANTGIFAPYGASGNTGTITGNVTVERYIPHGFRAYRDIAPEVYNAGTIYRNWQENGANNAGYGIFITGPTAYTGSSNAGTVDANGFDKSGTSSSNTQDYNFLPANATPWTALTNTNATNLVPFRGYRVLIRGDRSANIYTTNVINTQAGLTMYNATTLRATGQLVTGTVTYSTSGVTNTSVGSAFESSIYGLNATTNGFSLVANPYVSPVQWSNVYSASSNINGSYWYLDPTSSATGKYIAYNAITGSPVTVSGTTGNYTTSSAVVSTGYIQPGQAVFVQTTGATPTVVFQETAKATGATKASVFGTASLSKLYVSLLKQTTTGYSNVDGAAVAFNSNFGNKVYGPQDAIKFSGANDNIYISDKGKNLSIDGRLPATASDAIALKISNPTATAYRLSIDASAYANNGFEPLLYDAFKNTTKALGTGTTTVDFTVDTAKAASFSNRFTILFAPSALPVNSIVANASLSNKIATITWNTVGEKNVASYEVEKSTDAKNFAAIGQVTAKNTATASYATTDNSVTATTYYRIKAISTACAFSYSNIAKLSIVNSQLSISLYPNPLTGKTLNVSLDNVVAGKYTVSISNALGQRVITQTISHTGGSATHAISINSALAAGVYNVSISEANSKQVVHQNSLIVEN